jgi:hypothetical protein
LRDTRDPRDPRDRDPRWKLSGDIPCELVWKRVSSWNEVYYILLYTFITYHNRPQNCHCAPLFSRDLNSDRSWNHFFRDYFGSDISRKWPTEVMGLARVGYSLCSALEKKVEVIQPECGKPMKTLPIQVRLLGWIGKYMVNIW